LALVIGAAACSSSGSDANSSPHRGQIGPWGASIVAFDRVSGTRKWSVDVADVPLVYGIKSRDRRVTVEANSVGMAATIHPSDPCSPSVGVLIDLDASDGQVLGRRRPASGGPDRVGPSGPGEIARRGSASFVVEVEKGRPVVKAVDIPTGRTMWVSSLPDPHHQLFKAPRNSSAVGVLVNDTLYVAVASNGSDVSGCGGD
jgi:hypothetical protein